MSHLDDQLGADSGPHGAADPEHAKDCPVCQLLATPETIEEVEVVDFYVLDYDGEVHTVRGVVEAQSSDKIVQFHHHVDDECHTTVFVLEAIIKWTTEPIGA